MSKYIAVIKERGKTTDLVIDAKDMIEAYQIAIANRDAVNGTLVGMSREFGGHAL